MRIGEFETRTCYYEDCVTAMRRIPSSSIELCMADPPFNLAIGSMGLRKASRAAGKLNSAEIYYDDSMPADKYVNFTKQWSAEVFRTSKRIVVTPGEKNLMTWYKNIAEPVAVLYHYKPNSSSPGHISWKMCIETILMYGDWHTKQCFASNVFNIPIRTKANDALLRTILHPCAKCYELWISILKSYVFKYGKPHVVMDPFLGSGVTAQACEELDIEWIGFEIDTRYKSDIDKRIAAGIMEREKRARNRLY